MNVYTVVLIPLTFLISFGALIYTLKLGKGQNKYKGELDSPIPENIQENIYTKNPIFYAYGLFALIMIVMIMVLAFSYKFYS